MDTLKYEQIKELQDHQAIRYGTLKMTAAVTVTLILLAICVWFGFSITKQLTGKVPGDINFDVGVLFMVVTMLGAGLYMVTGARREWLLRYWSRNVRGYTARFWFADAGDLQHIILPYTEDEKDRAPRHSMTRRLCDVAVSLPLNGRIVRPWLAFVNKASKSVIESRLEGWSVRLRAIFDIGAVMVEVRKHNRFWGVDERIVTDVGSALRHLEEIATTTGSAASSVSDFVNWIDIKLDVARCEREKERKEFAQSMDALFRVLDAATGQAAPPVQGSLADWLVEQVRRLVAERDAARGEVDSYKDGFLPAAVKDRDEAREQRNEAVAFVESVATEIAGSSRLLQAIEGLRLLDRIRNWLCRAYTGTDKHADAQANLAIVREKLAEKEKRVRRRHRKKTDPASAPAA